MVRVLVVEDEANIREMIALNLRLAGMEAVAEQSSYPSSCPVLSCSESRTGCYIHRYNAAAHPCPGT